MTTVTLTSLTFSAATVLPQTFWVDWDQVDDPGGWKALPNANTDPLGNIISPAPYQFSVPDVPIKVRVRNQNKCGDWFEKEFNICNITLLVFNITP